MRILKSHPLLRLVNSYIIDASEPSNISYLWNFGSLLAVCLIVQIITGVTLAMHYNPNVLEAFNSVEHIMRDVSNGWLIRYLHSNTASAFFFLVSIACYCFYLCVYNHCNSITFIFYNFYLMFYNGFSLLKDCGSVDPYKNIKSSSTFIDNNKYSLSDEDFNEWFRGFVDAEGCFSIQNIDNRFKFIFSLCLHVAEVPLINKIFRRLGVGNIHIRSSTVNYTISNKEGLAKIFSILDKKSLNTTKYLNYITFRQAYDLYANRGSRFVEKELKGKILSLKDQMNKKRVNFDLPLSHSVNISRYWLLGFIEGDGFFSVNRSDYSVKFGIGQIYYEYHVMEEIKTFLLNLPGVYLVKRNNTNIVKLETYNQAKGRDYNSMMQLLINQRDFFTNVLTPFLDELTWLSKKAKDYEDWKLVLHILNQGKHFTDEGKELIELIYGNMNSRRTHLSEITELDVERENLKIRTLNLLSTPSNYEVQPDGRILVKSTGTYLKGRGNVGVDVFDADNGKQVYSFDSIKDCATFFNVHSRSINRRISNQNTVEFNDKKLVFKRKI